MKTNQSSSFGPQQTGGIGRGPEEGTGPLREQDGEVESRLPFGGRWPGLRAGRERRLGNIFYLLACRPTSQGEPIEPGSRASALKNPC